MKHLARSVYDEEDFGRLTFCGVVLDDHSAVTPSKANGDVCRRCSELAKAEHGRCWCEVCRMTGV
jgi:hypothetical protein